MLTKFAWAGFNPCHYPGPAMLEYSCNPSSGEYRQEALSLEAGPDYKRAQGRVHTPLIQTLQRQSPVDLCEFQESQSYTLRETLSGGFWDRVGEWVKGAGVRTIKPTTDHQSWGWAQ